MVGVEWGSLTGLNLQCLVDCWYCTGTYHESSTTGPPDPKPFYLSSLHWRHCCRSDFGENIYLCVQTTALADLCCSEDTDFDREYPCRRRRSFPPFVCACGSYIMGNVLSYKGDS